MAADQRKRRLNSTSITSFREQSKAKKKKLGYLQCDLDMRSNIFLEWDDMKKSVVAKREQIGLTWRDSIQFIDYVPHFQNILADVLPVPSEIFELDNLKEVLSYEVWVNLLSENERNYLTQFLPKGAEMHHVVQELLAGDNFHFGNPFLKWGASLCSGNLHPDSVLHMEQYLKTSKKSYYSELQKYHNGMIGNLLMWKERWASCEDPEKEIVHKIWRSRKQAERSISNDTNKSIFYDAEEVLTATSESDSWAAEEKAGCSDGYTLMRKHGGLQKRKGFLEDDYDNLSGGLKVEARARKGEKLAKQNIHCVDSSKFMSYFKVSREQHQRVKSSMKNSSNSIHSRYLNRVLGNLDTFHVRPFELFEEEEQKKLHDHWLQLATRDLPAAFANWRTWQKKKWEFAQSLEQEMGKKLKSLKEDEEKENAHIMLPYVTVDRTADSEATITLEVEEKRSSESLLEEKIGGADNHIAPDDEKKDNPDTVVQEMMDAAVAKHEPTIEDDKESLPASMQNQLLQSIPSLNGSHEFRLMDLDSDSHVIMETDDISPTVSKYPKNLNNVDITVNHGDPLSSTCNIWPGVVATESYIHSLPVNRDRSSVHELSLDHSQVFKDQSSQLIDLESVNLEDDTVKNLLHRQLNDRSFVNPYTTQDVQERYEVLQHFLKGQEGFHYHHEQKQTGLDFHPASKGLNDIYMHPNIQEKMFSDGGRYNTIPRQEHLSSVNVQDWAVNTVHMSAPLQSNLDAGVLDQNWFSGEHRVRGGWSSVDAAVPTQSIRNRSDTEGSLFSVFSQCNELHPHAPYNSMGSNERLIQTGIYGGAVGAPVPAASNMLPRAAHPLDYFSRHEAATDPVKSNNVGWMSVPHQNPATQDVTRRPFLRPWNK